MRRKVVMSKSKAFWVKAVHQQFFPIALSRDTWCWLQRSERFWDNSMLILRNTLIWSGFLGLAFLNGAIRELGVKKFISEPWTHYISGLTADVVPE